MLVLQDVEVEEKVLMNVWNLPREQHGHPRSTTKRATCGCLTWLRPALEESIDIFSVQGSSSPEVDQAGLLTNLAAVYITRFDHSGDTCISMPRSTPVVKRQPRFRQSLRGVPLILSNLAAILSKRFRLEDGRLTVDGEISRDVALDNLGDLDDAIEIVRKALRTMPEG